MENLFLSIQIKRRRNITHLKEMEIKIHYPFTAQVEPQVRFVENLDF